MKKTYLKPKALTVKIVPQQVIALSRIEGKATNNTVYGRGAEFSDWSEDEE